MHQCDYCCWYYNGNCDCPYVMKKQACENALKTKEREMKDLLEKYKMFQTPKPANEISWKDMKEFNSYMKEVVRDYKIKQAKSIQSARNVIIS